MQFWEIVKVHVRQSDLWLDLKSAALTVRKERWWRWGEAWTETQGGWQPMRTNWNLQLPLTTSRPLASSMRRNCCRRSCCPPQSYTWTWPGFGKTEGGSLAGSRGAGGSAAATHQQGGQQISSNMRGCNSTCSLYQPWECTTVVVVSSLPSSKARENVTCHPC